jgi:hypothetical protein
MSQPNPSIPQRQVCRSMDGSGGGNGRLASYLTAGVAGAMMATAHSDAGVVLIDLTNVAGFDITGPDPSTGNIPNWLGMAGSGTLNIQYYGVSGSFGLEFAVLDASSPASPRNFGANDSIGSSISYFTGSQFRTEFQTWVSAIFTTVVSPNFGAGSFMGFRFGSSGSYNYGYLEVTWNSTTTTWQILSGAYESTVNTAIAAGATPVPAPSALALLALGGGAFRRARARAA